MNSMLLIEDSPDDAYFFNRAVAKLAGDVEVRHVTTGRAAVQALTDAWETETQVPEMIIMDLKMPEMSGFDVLDWLQRQEFNDRIRKVILSGSMQECDRERAAALGACDYITKPVTAESLTQQLEQLAAATFAKRDTSRSAAPTREMTSPRISL